MRRTHVAALLAAAIAAVAGFLLYGGGEGPGGSAPVAEGSARPASPSGGPAARSGPGAPVGRSGGTEGEPASAQVEVRVEGPGETKVVEGMVPMEGFPIPGAAVLLRAADGAERTSATDGEGRAIFEGVPDGDLQCRASAAGFAASDWREAVRGGVTVLRLEPAVALEGIVLDARTGLPVGGARVRALGAEPWDAGPRIGTIYTYPGIEADARTWGEGVSGPDGRFRIDGIPPGTPQLVVANAGGISGRAALTAPLPGKSQAPLVIHADRTGRIAGRVAPPGPGIHVAVAPGTEPGALEGILDGSVLEDLRFHDGVTRIVRTDAEGRFHFEGLALGVPWAVVAKGADAPSEAATEVVLTDARPERTVDLALRRWGRVVIRVLQPDGLPPGECSASVDGWRGSGSGTPGAGLWTYDRVVPGSRRVVATAPGFGSGESWVEVLSGETAEATIHLEAGLPLEGVLVDGEERPVAGAEVRASWFRDEEAFGLVASTRTDNRGRFRLEGLGRGPHRLEATAAKGRGIAIAVVEPAEGLDPVRLVLQPIGALRITVRDRDGDPVRQAWVDVRGPVYRCGFTGEDGVWETDLPPGLYAAGFTYDQGAAQARTAAFVREGETFELALSLR